MHITDMNSHAHELTNQRNVIAQRISGFTLARRLVIETKRRAGAIDSQSPSPCRTETNLKIGDEVTGSYR